MADENNTEKQDPTASAPNTNIPVNAAENAAAPAPEKAPDIHHAPAGKADHGDPVQAAKDDPAVSPTNPINNETSPASAPPASPSEKIPNGEKQITLKVDGVTKLDKTFSKETSIADALKSFGIDASKLEFTDAKTGAKVGAATPLKEDTKVNATTKSRAG